MVYPRVHPKRQLMLLPNMNSLGTATNLFKSEVSRGAATKNGACAGTFYAGDRLGIGLVLRRVMRTAACSTCFGRN